MTVTEVRREWARRLKALVAPPPPERRHTDEQLDGGDFMASELTDWERREMSRRFRARVKAARGG